MFNKDIILKALESKGWTKYKLSKVSGVPQSSLHDILSGKIKNPTAERLKQLALALDMSVNDFFNNELKNENIQNNPIKESKPHSKEIATIVALLEGKDITPKKMKLLKSYIDTLFDDFDD